MKYWVKLKNEDIIRQHITVEAIDLNSALVAALGALDISKPVICEKHHAELERFSRTIFYPDDFIDSVSFDTLEIEIITKRKKT